MNNRIIVQIEINEHSLSFRTRQGRRASPHWFYISRGEFEALGASRSVIVSDIHSYSRLRMDRKHGLLEMDFTWLSGSEASLSGYSQTVRLPWDRVRKLLDIPYAEGIPHAKMLSRPPAATRPRLVFDGNRANLRAAVRHPAIRRKLAKALMANFNWPGADEIRLVDDFTPYSFFFREYVDDRPVMCGGLILHGQEDMSKAYYGIHT